MFKKQSGNSELLLNVPEQSWAAGTCQPTKAKDNQESE